MRKERVEKKIRNEEIRARASVATRPKLRRCDVIRKNMKEEQVKIEALENVETENSMRRPQIEKRAKKRTRM